MQNRPIADIIEDITLHAGQSEGVTLRQCVALLEQRSIEILILFFALLNSLPIPSLPGLSTITGVPIILLGMQMVMGLRAIWLPQRFQAYELHHGRVSKTLQRLLPYVRRLESTLRPRWLWMSDEPYTRFCGLGFIAMATLLALPIPFLNCPTGIAMSLLALGLITRDGVLILGGCGCILVILTTVTLLFDTIATQVSALLSSF